jgi:hypothetical protein
MFKDLANAAITLLAMSTGWLLMVAPLIVWALKGFRF